MTRKNMITNSFCDFERFEQPSEGTKEVVDLDISSDKSSLSHKLEQIGFELQTTVFDKDMIASHPPDNVINEIMGDVHYFGAMLRGLVLDCVELEKKAGVYTNEIRKSLR
jgi:hypothetical protein